MSQFRRLPVYLLLDCSESMAGIAFDAMRLGIQSMMKDLRSDPMALEVAAVSIITFATRARQVVPLTELVRFTMPGLQMGSGTALGAGLQLLGKCMDNEVVKTTAERKGDYKPVVFIMTDGDPTDAWESAADAFRSKYSHGKATVIAVAVGPDADTKKLARVTETVLVMKGVEAESFMRFFRWISASVSTSSQQLDRRREGGADLPPLSHGDLEPARNDESVSGKDAGRFAFLHIRCNKTRQFYVARFERQFESERDARRSAGARYRGVASHIVEDFDTEGLGKAQATISTSQLSAPTPCPCCGNVNFGFCACGGLLCCPVLKRSVELTCPWCRESAVFEPISAFDISRGNG